MSEYKVVTGDTSGDLVNSVSLYLSQGYILQGGVSVTISGVGTNVGNWIIFAQAMIKD